MTKRALLIGSQTDGLSGVHNDVHAMEARLAQRGFTTDVLSGGQATAGAIRDGYERLIHDSDKGDVAVVYYSGHGGRLVHPRPFRDVRRVTQCIVPVDWNAGGTFSGILDLELSLLQARLTDKTANVAVFMDCCHAQFMSRGPDDHAMCRSTKREWNAQVDERLSALWSDARRLAADSNPHAVRLGASEADLYAFETMHALHGKQLRMGTFTHALAQVFDEVEGQRVSWHQFLRRVRELVMSRRHAQKPQIEGPSDRFLFELESTERRHAVGYCEEDGRPALRAGRLLGAEPGIKYHVLPFDAPKYDPKLALATATVSAQRGEVSFVDLEPLPQAPRPPEAGDAAYPLVMPYPRLSLAVDADAPGLRGELRAAVENSRFLVPAKGTGDAALTLRVKDGTVRLWDDCDEELVAPYPTEEAMKAFETAERWSHATAVRTFASTARAVDPITVQFGRVEDGKPIPMQEGDTLYVGDWLYVEVTNNLPYPVWVAILFVDMVGQVGMFDNSEFSRGRKLERAERSSKDSWQMGRRKTGDWVGRKMHIPAGARLDERGHVSRRESLIILAADTAADFFTLRTVTPLDAGRSAPLGSEPSSLLRALRQGHSRSAPEEDVEDSAGFSVQRIDYTMSSSPRPRPQAAAESIARGEYAIAPRSTRPARRLRPDELCAGDILLSLGQGRLSESIAGLDGGWYSHAALWIHDPEGDGKADPNHEVLESTTPRVRCVSLAKSLNEGHREYVDVFRDQSLTREQGTRIVQEARRFVNSSYDYGDLLLGAAVVSSASLLFRGNEEKQRYWLDALQSVHELFRSRRPAHARLVTCAELVATAYHAAGVPIEIDLSGLRVFQGPAMATAVYDLARARLSSSKGMELSILDEVTRIQAEFFAWTGAEPIAALPDGTPADQTDRGARKVAKAGVDWSLSLVTPRDLMQSPRLERVGILHP